MGEDKNSKYNDLFLILHKYHIQLNSYNNIYIWLFCISFWIYFVISIHRSNIYQLPLLPKGNYRILLPKDRNPKIENLTRHIFSSIFWPSQQQYRAIPAVEKTRNIGLKGQNYHKTIHSWYRKWSQNFEIFTIADWVFWTWPEYHRFPETPWKLISEEPNKIEIRIF